MSVAKKKQAAYELALQARARHRLWTRLGMLALVVSGVLLGGLMYFETTALAPGRAALVLRSGALVGVVTDAGQVWRIPMLDKVVQVDLQPQPLPGMRQAVTAGDGSRATVELQATWQVSDAVTYWRATAARPEAAARLIEEELARVVQQATGASASAIVPTAASRQVLAREIHSAAAPALERAGLRLQDLRVTSVQTIR